MANDLCPSRDYGPHFFEQGRCALCHAPVAWDDATTPRTDDPVYFNSMTHSPRSSYTHRASEN